MKKIILLLCPLFILLSSCETDFDVSGDWKEIAVVYGILNKNDATHYIRINKAFLGDEDAFIMAQENDSINYDSLTVRLIELTESGTAVDSFLLEETTISLENDTNAIFGDEGNPLQKLWKTTETLDQTKLYKIKVINEASGNVVTAETPIVKSFSISQPSASPQSKVSFIGNNDAYSSYSVKFAPAGNGKVYEVTIVFYYREVNLVTNDTTQHSVTWKQSQYVADPNESLIQINLEGENFYSYVGSVVGALPSADYTRLIGKGLVDTEPDGNSDDHIDVFINVGGEELYNYIEINKPAASGVLLDKPVYTNIENGLGIFSSRTSNSVVNKSLSVKSVTELKAGDYTGALGFRQEND
jgi:hypothetical protein